MKNKYLLVTLMLIVTAVVFANTNLVENSVFNNNMNRYQYKTINDFIDIKWNAEKKISSEFYVGRLRISNIGYYQNGNISFMRNECYYLNEKTKDTVSYLCGKMISFNMDESKKYELCNTGGWYEVDDSIYIGKKCGTEIHYQPDGTKKIIEHKRKCKDPCELHFVKRHQGLYTVLVDALRVREKPSDKAKTIFTIYKDQEVELLEDTQIFFKVDFYVAPWVKIKTKDGRIGYVYGAFLKTKELYVEAGE